MSMSKPDTLKDVPEREISSISDPDMISFPFSPDQKDLNLQKIINKKLVDVSENYEVFDLGTGDDIDEYLVTHLGEAYGFYDQVGATIKDTVEIIKIHRQFIFSLQRGGIDQNGLFYNKFNTRIEITSFEFFVIPYIGLLIEYRLLSIICHEGTANGGHYVCYFRYADGEKWYYYNDMRPSIKEVNINDEGDINENYGMSHKRFIEENGYVFFSVMQRIHK